MHIIVDSIDNLLRKTDGFAFGGRFSSGCFFGGTVLLFKGPAASVNRGSATGLTARAKRKVGASLFVLLCGGLDLCAYAHVAIYRCGHLFLNAYASIYRCGLLFIIYLEMQMHLFIDAGIYI